MRVGFVTQLVWRRYGRFWLELVRGAGLEAVVARPAAVKERWPDAEKAGVPTVAFRLAAAQALALSDCDVIVVPMLLPETDVLRGAGQDPWVADFPAALRSSLPALPPLQGVPSWFDASVESRAVAFLRSFVRDPASVRRVLGRVRPHARPERREPPPPVRRQGAPTVAVIGRPWVVNERLAAAVEGEGENLVWQHDLDEGELRAEGLRQDARLVDADAEVIGAARLLGRRAGVDSVRLVADAESGADAWLASRISRATHKPFEVVTLQAALAGRDPVDTLLDGRID